MVDPKADNLSAVLYKINDLRLEQRPIPVPKDDEVLIKMACVGICGSDVHYLTHGRIGDFVVNSPMVIGHEASGVVAQVGKDVKNLKIGDRVAIEPGVPCRRCDFCKKGVYNLCPDIFFCATPPDDGNLCRYYTHASDFCYKLPDNMSNVEGALLEPLAVGCHACRLAKVDLGSKVLITGAGPIGLVMAATAKAMGATAVVITETNEHRMNIAKTIGADHVLLDDEKMDENVLVKKIHDLLGQDPDMSIDCCGSERTHRLAMKATKPGGVAIIVGLRSPEAKTDIADLVSKEVTVIGSFRYCNDYPLALEMVATGKVNVKQIVTHNYDLEQTLEAFETARTGRGDAIKVIIHCSRCNCKK